MYSWNALPVYCPFLIKLFGCLLFFMECYIFWLQVFFLTLFSSFNIWWTDEDNILGLHRTKRFHGNRNFNFKFKMLLGKLGWLVTLKVKLLIFFFMFSTLYVSFQILCLTLSHEEKVSYVSVKNLKTFSVYVHLLKSCFCPVPESIHLQHYLFKILSLFPNN